MTAPAAPFRWEIRNGDVFDADLAKRFVSVSFNCYPTFERRKAALELMAAAPALLAACEAAKSALFSGYMEEKSEHRKGQFTEAFLACDAAIDKVVKGGV